MIGTPRIAGQTYAGRSVRWKPGQSRGISMDREINQLDLVRGKFQPTFSVTNDLADEMDKWGKRVDYDPDEHVLLDSVPTQWEPVAVPSGNTKPYDFLKTRAEAGQIRQPITVQQLPIVDGNNGFLGQVDISSGSPVISIRDDQSPMQKAALLAHEMGHYQSDHMGNQTPFAHAETEAEAISYGVMNRMYPWNNAQREASAKYILDLGSADPDSYLLSRNTSQRVNAGIDAILPKPRQPFARIIPEAYAADGINTSATRNLNPVVAAYQQEELMAQAALNDRYARYGY